MKRVVLLLLAGSATFLVAVVGGSQTVSACSCFELTDQQAFDRADTVFAGTLVEILAPPDGTYASTDVERFVFAVDAVYKGDALHRQQIVTPHDGASCGLEIQGPGPFLVYADSTEGLVVDAVEGERYAGLCGGTRAVADGAVPAAFGIGRAPTTPAPSGLGGPSDASPERPGGTASSTTDDRGDTLRSWMLVTVAGAAMVGLAAGIVVVRRRPPSAER